MPELPEVETIKRGLSRKIIGHTITDVTILNAKSFQGLKAKIIGQKIIGVDRRAKVLRLMLENNQNLLFHLKMTGQLIYLYSKKRIAGGHPSHDWHADLPNKHTRLIIHFDHSSALFFNDLRKFGWCKILSDSEVDNIFSGYGPEPFSPEFTVQYLIERAKKIPNRTIKQFLMDQSIIAGVGNIYNDESLYLSKVSPLTKVKSITPEDWQNIHKSLRSVLEKGIKFGGTTDSDYVDSEGKKGGMQEHLNVYHRNGLKCIRCKGTIVRINIGGRGTYYCPTCQKELHG